MSGADSDTSGRADSPRPSDIRVYVNEQGVSVAPGSTALDAVRAFSAEQASLVAAGGARLTDSRGLPIDAACPVSGGLILRVLPVRDRAAADPTDVTEGVG